MEDSLGESAAVQYCRRIARLTHAELERGRKTLREILGANYKIKYEILLNVVDQSELDNIQTLTSGRNGRIRSALWNQSHLLGSVAVEPIPVVLKNVIVDTRSEGNDTLAKFLQEVTFVL